MNIEDLTIFETLSRSFNMSEVAREMYISQSSVSYSISKLESELGVKLFTRNGKKLSHTPEGHMLLSRVSSIVKAYSDLRSLFIPNVYEQYLRVGWSHSVGEAYANTILSSYATKCPEICVFSMDGSPRQLLDMFEDHQLDILITGIESVSHNMGGGQVVSCELLDRSRLIFVCSAASNFVKQEALEKHLVRTEDLEVNELPVLLKQPISMPARLGTMLPQNIQGESPPCRVIGLYDSFCQALDGARFGLGAALVPDMLIDAADKDICWFESAGLQFEDDIYICIREADLNQRVISSFFNFTKKFFQEKRPHVHL